VFFAGSFFAAIMLKETSVIIGAFFVLFIILEKIFFNKSLKVVSSLFAVALPLFLSAFVYIHFAGGIGRAIEMIRIILIAPMTNEYVLMYQTGSFFRYLYDYFLISPLTLVAALIFILLYITGRDRNYEPYAYLVVFFIVLYSSFSFFNKNIRAVMALDFSIRVFTAILISNMFIKFKEKSIALSMVAVILIAAFDFAIFRHIFVIYDVYDPVTYNLEKAWQVWGFR
jgi:hypothetical protein